MIKRLISIILATVACLQIGFTPADAQTVAIQSNDQVGHGFIFKHASQCYVVLPRHLVEGQRRVKVFSSAPVVYSGAVVDTPFWDGLDLAIGVVRGPIMERCTRTLDYFSSPKSTADGSVVQLLRLRESGEIERVNMIVTKGDYLTLQARITEKDKELFKGTSGAFLFAGGTPIGMVTDNLTESDTEGLFIRMEEIHMNLKRRLNRRAGFVSPTASETQDFSSTQNNLPMNLISVTLPPTFPDFGEENLLGPGSYVFELTRTNRISFQVTGDEAAILSRVRIKSNPAAPYTLPKGLRIDVSSKLDGTRPRSFLDGEMGLDGLYDATRQPSKVRWIFITVTSGWDNGPIGIDTIEFQ